MKAQVFILGGRDVGRSYTVEESARLGRSPECEVPLRDRSISRVHARLVREGDSWFLEDPGSRNGVRHKGKRVKRMAVSDRDEFLLGELPIRICLASELEELEEFEFVDEVPARASVARPVAVPEEDLGEKSGEESGEEFGEDIEEEIEFEDEIELEGFDDEVDEYVEEHGEDEFEAEVEIGQAGSPQEAERSAYEMRRRQILQSESGRGLLRGDLSQQPLWKRCFAFLIVLGFFAALAYLAFKGVALLRS